MYNINMSESKDKIKNKCDSCGASILDTEKQCSYCGSANPNYIKKELKEIKPNYSMETADDNLGSFLGGVVLGGALGGLRNFFGRRKR